MTFSLLKRLGCLTMLFAGLPIGALADDTVRLREEFPTGYQYHVSSRVELSGKLSLPAEKGGTGKSLPLTGESAIEYDERVLAAGASGEVERTARIYRRLDFQRTVGDQPQQNTLRPSVRRLVVLRLKSMEVPFSPDGPLTWNEIDMVRTDVFTPALAGLLPKDPVRAGEHWPASALAVQELTDLERIEEGKITCRLEGITSIQGRRLARIALAGTVRGMNEDGPNRQQLEGYFLFDLESNHLSYLTIQGVHYLLDKEGQEQGRVEGRFVLTRQAHQRSKDLTDEALKGVVLEPNNDNTLLLYENSTLNVRFLHPRRWRVAGARGAQVGLDETAGSGLLLTVEPLGRVPSGAQFLKETRDWLEQQKLQVLRVDQPHRLQAASGELEHFSVEIETAGKRAVMDYYVVRQAKGGATLAARLLPGDLPQRRLEVERIARSVTIIKEIGEGKR